jgi:hypothetical protein
MGVRAPTTKRTQVALPILLIFRTTSLTTSFRPIV